MFQLFKTFFNTNITEGGQEFRTLLQQSQRDGDEMIGAHPEMKTFCQTSGPVTPYATTALLQAQAQASKPGMDQLFRQTLQHSGGSGDSNTDRSNTTGRATDSLM